MKKVLAVITALLSAIYIINPGFGVFEFIPDNIPFIGNLDEAGATALLIASLKYLGVKLPSIFEKK
jgi:hypothetical protein